MALLENRQGAAAVAARLVEAIKKKANSSFIFTRCHHLVDPSLYKYIHTCIHTYIA